MMQRAHFSLRVSAAVFIVGFCLLSGKPVFADDKDALIQSLLQRIDGLEKKVEGLSSRLTVYERSPATTVSEETVQRKVDDILTKREEKEGGLVKALKDITLSGFVDTSYSYNFHAPDSRSNTARVFDTEANNFSLQAAELVLEKLPPDSGGLGFRTDLYMGQDAEVITPTGSTRDQFDLQQAYVTLKPPLNFKLPFGNWLWIKLGKFVTMHGAEVIESKDNWNFTRSLLFGYAIPFTHTGIRAGYQFFDGLSGYLGFNNGWDNVKDNNKTKSVEGALAWSANDKLSFNLAGMYGPEQTGNDHSQRGLMDFLATYKFLPKWTLMFNADYAHEEDAVARDKGGSWSGVAGYLKYDAYDWLSFISRTEFFSDRQGLRVTSGTSQDLWETTFTTDLRPYKDLITRLEFRYDKSSGRVFTHASKAADHQETLALEVIYPF